jgi:hypothetical protein
MYRTASSPLFHMEHTILFQTPEEIHVALGPTGLNHGIDSRKFCRRSRHTICWGALWYSTKCIFLPSVPRSVIPSSLGHWDKKLTFHLCWCFFWRKTFASIRGSMILLELKLKFLHTVMQAQVWEASQQLVHIAAVYNLVFIPKDLKLVVLTWIRRILHPLVSDTVTETTVYGSI